jgi:hypothetical protein
VSDGVVAGILHRRGISALTVVDSARRAWEHRRRVEPRLPGPAGRHDGANHKAIAEARVRWVLRPQWEKEVREEGISQSPGAFMLRMHPPLDYRQLILS